MIAVIGGVKTTVSIEMKPPERDIEKQKKQDEDALLAAGIEINGPGEVEAYAGETENREAERFRQYYESKMREQARENYWNDVGFGSRDFGGYSVVDNENADIRTVSSGCSYTVAKILGEKMEPGEVVFISVVGNDALGLAATCSLEKSGVDVSAVKIMEGSTPIGVEIHNIIGDLEFCRENNALMEAVSPQYIDQCGDILAKADGIFIDGTLSVETLNHISEKYSGKCKIFFDPDSITGGMRFAESRLTCFCVMPGRMEAEAMTGLQILGIDKLAEAGTAFEGHEIDNAIITLKGGGLYYKEGAESGIIKPAKVLPTEEVAGAGDVLSAELMRQVMMGTSVADAAQAAMDAAAAFLCGR